MSVDWDVDYSTTTMMPAVLLIIYAPTWLWRRRPLPLVLLLVLVVLIVLILTISLPAPASTPACKGAAPASAPEYRKSAV